MKKLLVSVLAIAGLVACSQEQTLVQQGPAPMEFGAAFIDNATRADKAVDPSITTATITGFDVWGFMDSAEGVVFNDEDVTGETGNFTYVNTQYWAPGHQYYFAALAPMNSPNVTETLASGDAAKLGLGTIEFNVTDGAEDLLYSAVGPIASPAADATTVEPVKFQFNHMLSKVKFSFTNSFDNDNAYIDVKNIKMVVPAKGSINLAVADWWSTNQWVLDGTTTEIAFGDACDRTARNGKQESADERIIFPADATQSYTVTFDVVLYQGTVEAYAGTKTVTIENVALEIGKAYNFKAELNASNITADGSELLPIVFDVEEVKDWVTAETPDANVQEAELRAAMQFGGKVTLANDVVLSSPIVVAKNTILDLNDKTITNAVNNQATDVIIVAEGATLTIEGDGVIEAVSGNDGYAIIAEGAVVINGGTIKSGVDANNEPNAVVYARGNGEVYVNGGYFPNDNLSKFVLNKKDADRATTTIEVRGGEFQNFNPANNDAENPGTNFVAAGYESYVIRDSFVVRPVVASKADILALLAEGVTEIDAKNASIGDLDRALTAANVPAGVTVTIKNAKFSGQSYNNVIDGDVVFENCEFNCNDGAYSINFGGGNGNVTFKNCTLYGWNSFGELTSVTMEGCKLFGNGIYALIRAYTTLTVTDCVFDYTNAIQDDKWPEAVQAYTVVENNCTHIR